MAATNTPRVGYLRGERKARGLTQIDLARIAGCSVGFVRLLEQGDIPRRSRVLPDILRALEQIPVVTTSAGSGRRAGN